MAKITLVAAPTFIAPIRIPVPGKGDAMVNFTFKHRDRAALEAYEAQNKASIDAGTPRADVDVVMDSAIGWELDEPFTRENVETFLNSYHGAGLAIAVGYVVELTKARTGN